MAKLSPELRAALAAVLDRTASEDQLKLLVMSYAQRHGWRRFHPLPCRPTNRGRIVTLAQGERGWPDLVLARDGVVLFRELKTEDGAPSDDQVVWLDLLERAGLNVGIWRPRDWLHTIAPTLVAA